MDGKEATAGVEAALEPEGISVTKTITRGRPADRIVSYLNDTEIDLITIGSRTGEHEQNMLGGTSQKVVAQSRAPVLTIDLSNAVDE